MGRRVKASRAAQHRSSHASAQRRKRRGDYSGEDFDDLVGQLRPLGLFVRKMEGDGNCLFRAFADQICGDCEEHQQYRDRCCELMLANAEDFRLFYAEEDEEEGLAYEAYVLRMQHPGQWGSQLELMALCQCHNVNAIVHQSGRPAYEMGTAPRDARCIQLSYHDGEHYNSIRFSWDLQPGIPAQHLSLLQLQGPAEGDTGEDVQQVRDLLPSDRCACATAIRAALARASGDPCAAAEYLLAEEFGNGGEGGGRGSAAAAEDNGSSERPTSGRQARGNKKAERRQAKEVGQRQRAADDIDEKMSLLGKQLLSV